MATLPTPTPRSVADIKSNLLRPALTSHFEVRIPIPPKLQEKDNSKQSFLEYNGISLSGLTDGKLNLLCSEATLPGSNLATLELNNDFHGVTERHAYRRIYDDRIDLTFYVDADNYLPIYFFEVWMKFCVDESIGQQSDKQAGSKDPFYFYRVKYPDEYVTQGLQVIKFERDYKNTLVYDFINAFPISISSMPVSYDSSALLKCTVSMSYIRYVLNKGSAAPIDRGRETSPLEQAAFNSNPIFENPQFGAGGVSELSGLSGAGALTTGGVPLSVANASGNSVNTRVEEGLPYVGRNVGPIATFSGI
jgi:hypothetical protein